MSIAFITPTLPSLIHRRQHIPKMSTPPIVRVGNLPANLRNAVQTASRAAISRTGKFTVAISGGSLPRLLAAALKEADEPFDKWNVYLADERLVPYDHADSNARAIDEHLPDLRVVRADTSLTGAECAKTYEASIANDVDGGFDAVLLGLGPDGHTCSLFPNHELLSLKGGKVEYISDSPKPPSERITLTLSELNASARAMFVCTGIGKAQVVKSILEEDNCQLPGALVRDPMVEWFLDEAAASHLSDGTAQS